PLAGRKQPAPGRPQFPRPRPGGGNPALAACATPAAGCGNGNIGALQDLEQFGATLGGNHLSAIDGHRQRYVGHQSRAGGKQAERQRQDQANDEGAAQGDLDHGNATWAKVEKPSDIMPVMMKAIPSPCNPPGRSAQASRRQIAESMMTAKAKPVPEPSPNTVL